MTHEAQYGCPLRSVVSPLGPGSRYARPGHETGLRLAERERRDRCPHAPTPTLARKRHAVYVSSECTAGLVAHAKGAVQRAAPVNNRKNTGRGVDGSPPAPAIRVARRGIRHARGHAAAGSRRRLDTLGCDPRSGCTPRIHDAKQRSLLRSRGAFFAPGLVFVCSHPSLTRGGRSADRRICFVVAFGRRD